MAGPGPIFREIHHLRRHIKDVQDELSRQPRLLKSHQNRVLAQETAKREAQELQKKLKVDTMELESQLKSTNQKIEKYTKQKNDVTSKKEMDALDHEITAARQKCTELEDQILEVLGQIDDVTAKLPEHENALRKARTDLAEFERSSAERVVSLQSLLTKAQGELKAQDEKLPDDIIPSYNRLVASKGEDALAAVDGRTCRACQTEITTQAYHELLMGKFLACMSCARILYRAQD